MRYNQLKIKAQIDRRQFLISFSGKEAKFFTFFFELEALRANSMFDIERLHSEDDVVKVNETKLRRALEDLPCCTTSRDGAGEDDPLNLVLIGNATELMPAFVRRGWRMADDTYWSSTWKTVGSFLFGRLTTLSKVEGESRPLFPGLDGCPG